MREPAPGGKRHDSVVRFALHAHHTRCKDWRHASHCERCLGLSTSTMGDFARRQAPDTRRRAKNQTSERRKCAHSLHFRPDAPPRSRERAELSLRSECSGRTPTFRHLDSPLGSPDFRQWNDRWQQIPTPQYRTGFSGNGTRGRLASRLGNSRTG